MEDNNSQITILTCHDHGKKAAKKFVQHCDGTIEKISFNAGTYFSHKTVPVASLEELAKVIQDLKDDPRSFIIRGEILDNMPEIVRRKIHGDEAAFRSVARPYVMLDIDKLKCPDHFDVANSPEKAIQWIIDTLPEPFRGVDCYYKFSASQNVSLDDDKNINTISAHLWFWLNRPVSDDEWKRYFKSISSPVDTALFSPVQPHFIADPIFEDMDDPLPNRSGIYKGKHSVVTVPDIPKEIVRKPTQRPGHEPIILAEDRTKALELLAPYYKEGNRNRLCGAIAATMYRGGHHLETASDVVYELASMCSDEEAEARRNNAIAICEAVEGGRHAQGIPTLGKEFEIKQLDMLLDLLGIGKPDIEKSISQLTNGSSMDEIRAVLRELLSFSGAELYPVSTSWTDSASLLR